MSPKAKQIILIVLAFSLAYAFFRYHVFEGIPAKDFAVFVMNKVICLTGFILLSLNFALGPARKAGLNVPKDWLAARKELGIAAFLLILAHVLLSVLAFGSGAYYGKFFSGDGSLSAIGSWSMLLGVLAFVWLWLYNITFKTQDSWDEAFLKLLFSPGLLYVAGFLAAGHVVVMGFKGWLTPDKWAGGMPPITMVAVAAYVVCLGLNLKGRA